MLCMQQFVVFVVVLVTMSCLTLVTPWTEAHQSPLSMGFPRQEHWSGLPFSSLGDLPEPEIKPASPALAGEFFTAETPGKPVCSNSLWEGKVSHSRTATG